MKVKLPKSWESAPLGDVCKTLKGKKPKNSGKVSKVRTIPYINIKAFETGLPVEYAEPGNYPECSKDDVLIVWDGARSGLTGRGVAGYIGSTLSKIWSDIIDNGYLYYFLQSQYDFINTNTKGVGIPHVDPNILFAIDFSIAPENEQKSIVAEIEKQFSRLDKAVDNLKRVKANLKRYKASVLKAAVEGKLTENWRKANPDVEPASKLLKRILAERRKKWEEAEMAKMKAKGKKPKNDKWKKKYKEPAKPDLNDLPILPKEWKWVTWDTILEFDKGAFKRGPFGSSLKKSIFVDSGYKVYEQYCPINDDCSFARYFITDEKYNELKAFAVQAKDFLISCSGVSLGRITQVPDDYDEGVINQALLRVRLNNNIFGDSFFKMLFRSPYFQEQIFKNATGSAIPNVKGVNELKAIPLPLPTVEEQGAIITIIEGYMSVITVFDIQVEKNLKRAERLRQSILKNAFSGKLIPQSNNDESIENLRKQSA